MSVTKSKKNEEAPLDLYVDFLNADFSSDPRPKLKKGRKLKTFLDQFTWPDRFNLSTGEPIIDPSYNWLEKTKEIQGEMRNDLFPIAARKEIPEKLFPLLERWVYLTEKLNEIGFMRRWDPHPSKNKKGDVIIRGWNFKPGYNPRDIWYVGLAERLEDGDLHRLRLCPVCHKYFAAKDERQRFCTKPCKRKYDNREAKCRVKRWRVKQVIGELKKEEKACNREYEQRVKRFSEFIPFAISHSQDIKNVGPIVIRLGGGDPKEGWRRIKGWDNDLKNGISPEQIFKGLPQTIKNHFLSVEN